MRPATRRRELANDRRGALERPPTHPRTSPPPPSVCYRANARPLTTRGLPVTPPAPRPLLERQVVSSSITQMTTDQLAIAAEADDRP